MTTPKKSPRKSTAVKVKDLKRKSISVRVTSRVKGGRAGIRDGSV
jgi:hypothetical protein